MFCFRCWRSVWKHCVGVPSVSSVFNFKGYPLIKVVKLSSSLYLFLLSENLRERTLVYFDNGLFKIIGLQLIMGRDYIVDNFNCCNPVKIIIALITWIGLNQPVSHCKEGVNSSYSLAWLSRNVHLYWLGGTVVEC